MSRIKGSYNKRGINAMAKVTSFEGVEFEVTDKPEDVSSGKLVETFSISVATEDETTGEKTVHYANKNEPFEWNKVNSFPDVIAAHGGKLSEDAISFLGEALAGEENGKAVKSLIDSHNAVERANAKNNAYQRVMNNKKPMSQDDKDKAFNRMVETFAKLNNITLDVAKATLAGLKPAA